MEWKYGSEEGDWWPKSVRSTYGMGVWKAIANGLFWFKKETTFKIGNGHTVRFWVIFGVEI